MSVRNVMLSWVEAGYEPDDLRSFSPELQRQFLNELFLAEPEWFFDFFSDYFTYNPAKRVELTQALFDETDWLQAGGIMDRAARSYVFGKCIEFMVAEMTIVSEQESDYEGDA